MLDAVGHPTLRRISATVALRAFGWRYIPLLAFVRPRVVQLDDEVCEIKIPFARRTKNHLGSMYFGALAIGADCAAALGALAAIRRRKAAVNLIFKDFDAQFMRRIEGDCHLRSRDNRKLDALVLEAIESGERVETRVEVEIRVPSISGDEVLARCGLTVSLKRRSGSP